MVIDSVAPVFFDEVHLSDSKCTRGIMEKLEDTKYRFGTTGTLKKTETSKLVLTGLFGQPKQYVTTRELIDRGILSGLNINAIVLKHPEKLLEKSLWPY